MKSVLEKPKLKAQSSRNGFDLSAYDNFHTSFGLLSPVRTWEMVPDSYIEIRNETQIMGINPLIRPANMRLKQHIDYFAVPLVQLYSYFDNIITGQDQVMSSALDTDDSELNQLPMFGGDLIAAVLANGYMSGDVNGFPKDLNTCRLLDLLGYAGDIYPLAKAGKFGPDAWDDSNRNQFINDLNTLPMNFFKLAAYQKIYYSFYRNAQYEANDVRAYNFDMQHGTTFYHKNYQRLTNLGSILPMFDMHYRWNKKDYFMQVIPNILPNQSDIGFQGLQSALMDGFGTDGSNPVWQLFSLPGSLSGSMDGNSARYQTTVIDGNSINANSNVTGRRVAGAPMQVFSQGSITVGRVNVTALRFAFAYDRLLRRMRVAGGTFDKQMLAQFGIKPIDYRHGDCYYLGGFTNRINISDVTATSDSDSELGTLAGQINFYADNTKSKITYKAHEFCIVMAIQSFSVDNVYDSCNVDRSNLRQFRNDWFNPAFEDLGYQALYKVEMDVFSDQFRSSSPDQSRRASLSDQTALLGYVPRYSEYKTSVDRVHGLLQWSLQNASMGAYVEQYNVIYPNAMPTGSSKQSSPLAMPTMISTPAQFVKLLAVPYDGTWETDMFVIFMLHHVKMVAPMSVVGEIY